MGPRPQITESKAEEALLSGILRRFLWGRAGGLAAQAQLGLLGTLAVSPVGAGYTSGRQLLASFTGLCTPGPEEAAAGALPTHRPHQA